VSILKENGLEKAADYFNTTPHSHFYLIYNTHTQTIFKTVKGCSFTYSKAKKHQN